jgi:heme/copper-type cytochrome/quinol oxidase subunit 3
MSEPALARSRKERPPRERRPPVPGASRLAMKLFLLSLAVLFLASLVAAVVVRGRAAAWPPAGAPALPRLLWLSTLLLVGCSVAVHLAVTAIRGGSQRRLLRWLGVAAGLGLAFLACQTVAWLAFYDPQRFGADLYGFTFFMLTGLHAAHVLGGLVALGIAIVLARRGAFTWAHYDGVRNVALYWHFLDGVWLVLFGFLLAGF